MFSSWARIHRVGRFMRPRHGLARTDRGESGSAGFGALRSPATSISSPSATVLRLGDLCCTNVAHKQSKFAFVQNRVFCLEQFRTCLVEILALVNEVCATSPITAIIGLDEVRHLIHENAPAVTVPTSNSNVLGWLLGRKPTEFHECLRPTSAAQQRPGVKFGVDS